jgi:hypothetical protein
MYVMDDESVGAPEDGPAEGAGMDDEDVKGMEDEVDMSNRSDPSWRDEVPSDHRITREFDFFFYDGYQLNPALIRSLVEWYIRKRER